MIKFVLDADGLIKLFKSSSLEVLLKNTRCFVTEQVYQEILKGKEKLYEDAFSIESLVNNKMIRKIKAKQEKIIHLGKGESSIIAAFNKNKFDTVISDDIRFLKELQKRNIPFINSTEAITLLKLKNKLSKEEAINSLNKMKSFVKEENYEIAKAIIEGGKK